MATVLWMYVHGALFGLGVRSLYRSIFKHNEYFGTKSLGICKVYSTRETLYEKSYTVIKPLDQTYHYSTLEYYGKGGQLEVFESRCGYMDSNKWPHPLAYFWYLAEIFFIWSFYSLMTEFYGYFRRDQSMLSANIVSDHDKYEKEVEEIMVD